MKEKSGRSFRPLQTMSASEEAVSGSDYARLCKLIYAEAGIQLGTERKTMLEVRIKRRLKVLNFNTYGQYCDYLFGHVGLRDELVHLIDVVTTNKTDFFREAAHFDFLVDRALPEPVSVSAVMVAAFAVRPDCSNRATHSDKFTLDQSTAFS